MIIFFKMGFILQSEKTPGNFVISSHTILDHCRDTTYLSFIGNRFGESSQSLVKTLMLNGTMDYSDCIDQTLEFYQLTATEKGSSFEQLKITKG